MSMLNLPRRRVRGPDPPNVDMFSFREANGYLRLNRGGREERVQIVRVILNPITGHRRSGLEENGLLTRRHGPTPWVRGSTQFGDQFAEGLSQGHLPGIAKDHNLLGQFSNDNGILDHLKPGNDRVVPERR